MDNVGHFTACAFESDDAQLPDDVDLTSIAKRQSAANYNLVECLPRNIAELLYDVYQVRNERAGVALSVLVGTETSTPLVILMKGAFETGEEMRHTARHHSRWYYEDYDEGSVSGDDEDDEDEYSEDEQDQDQ